MRCLYCHFLESSDTDVRKMVLPLSPTIQKQTPSCREVLGEDGRECAGEMQPPSTSSPLSLQS